MMTQIPKLLQRKTNSPGINHFALLYRPIFVGASEKESANDLENFMTEFEDL